MLHMFLHDFAFQNKNGVVPWGSDSQWILDGHFPEGGSAPPTGRPQDPSGGQNLILALKNVEIKGMLPPEAKSGAPLE